MDILNTLNKANQLVSNVPTNNSSPTNANEVVNKIIESEELRKEIFSSFCKALISIINTHEGFFKDIFEKKLNEVSEEVIKETIKNAIQQTINADFLKSIISSEEIAKYLSHEIPPENLNQPTSQPTVAPQPTAQSTLAPQPTAQSTVAPQPTSQSTVAPQPTSQSHIAQNIKNLGGKCSKKKKTTRKYKKI